MNKKQYTLLNFVEEVFINKATIPFKIKLVIQHLPNLCRLSLKPIIISLLSVLPIF